MSDEEFKKKYGDFVWRTVRGVHMRIVKNKKIAESIKLHKEIYPESNVFDNREDVLKAKKQLKVDEEKKQSNNANKFQNHTVLVADKKISEGEKKLLRATPSERAKMIDNATKTKIEAFKEKKQSNNATNKYKETKRIGFGGYNNDDIPVYNNQIDYTGDFTRANLSKLSNEELTTALNKQRELYKNVVSEKIGDQRTRNGKMDKIFNTARKLQYEKGVKLLEEELKKRKGK